MSNTDNRDITKILAACRAINGDAEAMRPAQGDLLLARIILGAVVYIARFIEGPHGYTLHTAEPPLPPAVRKALSLALLEAYAPKEDELVAGGEGNAENLNEVLRAMIHDLRTDGGKHGQYHVVKEDTILRLCLDKKLNVQTREVYKITRHGEIRDEHQIAWGTETTSGRVLDFRTRELIPIFSKSVEWINISLAG
jgi:hypothetical protein